MEETYALVHLPFQEAAAIVHRRVFVTKELCDLHRVDEQKNFAANILLKLVVSHVLGSVHRLVSHVLRAVH